MGQDLLPELGHGDLPEGFSAQPWVSVHVCQSLQANFLSVSLRSPSCIGGKFVIECEHTQCQQKGVLSMLHD